MALVSLRNVTVAFGSAPVLDKVSLSIQPMARACVTGRNGEGKSTLLKVIAGIIPPDSGDRICEKSTKIAYLPQDVPGDRPGTVFSIIDSADSSQLDEHSAGAAAVITQLELDPDAQFNSLSGGLRRRVLLGCALVQKPALLLLDEPTNHLDIDAISWLENWLKTAQCACLFITHDRSFLRNVAKTVFDLDRGQLAGWDCDYTTFVKRKQELIQDEAVYWERKSKKLTEEEIWLRRGVKARTCRNEGRVAALMKLRDEFAQRRQLTGSAKLDLASSASSGTIVIKAQNISFTYDNKTQIISNFSARILRGEKIGIIGLNGAGKTTLIKLLIGELKPTTGTIELGSNVQIAHFDQMRELLNPNETVVQNLADGKDFVEINGSRKHVFGYLGDFLFTPERAKTPVKALSGGEKARLLLAKLFLNPGNLLVMDEPTNDLDIETLELLEEQLADYKGTILLVSHDREFLDHVVTSTFVLDHQNISFVPGGYEQWLKQRINETNAKNSTTKTTPTPQKQKNNNATRLSFNEQRLLKTLPEIIEKNEREIITLNKKLEELQNAGNKFNPAEYQTIAAQIEIKNKELETNYEEYYRIEEKCNAMRYT